MKIIVFVMLLLSLLNARIDEINDPFANIEYYQLENGLNVYLLSDDKAETTRIVMNVKVGTEVEDESTLGLSHLVEHLVFRDQRVPHRDYLDYIKQEGGTYVNGHTKRYKTTYLATIDSSKSYWITEVFAQMMFDKNVTTVDLEVEKGALQTEIGEYKWTDSLLWNYVDIFRTISPPKENIYRDEFALDEIRDLPALYLSKQNNVQFSLEQVMQHYETYYYPSNMTLNIVGNFDMEIMKQLIQEKYGIYHKAGTKFAIKPPENPELNHKAYRRFYEGAKENNGYIGAKYILNNYKTYLILNAYISNFALRTQQHLRNKLGKSYSVNPYTFNDRNAGVMSIHFDGLHDEFEANIEFVKESLLKDVASIDDETIDEALEAYQTELYVSREHDSDSLLLLVLLLEYLHVDLKATDKTPYEIFSSITHEEFRKVIKTVFVPENFYSYIYRDYYYFQYETMVVSAFLMLLLVLVYFKMYRIDYYTQGLTYTKRDIVLDRRLSNRFLGFLKFIFILLLSSLVWEWIKYLLSKFIMGDPYYLYTIDVPYGYVAGVMDGVFGIVLFFLVYRYGFNYYAHLDADKDTIYLIGNRITVLQKEMIKKIKVVPWSLNKFMKIKALVLFFWKPLVEVELKNGDVHYLRASDASHLEEDLHKCLDI